MRAEFGESDLGGSITYYPSEELPNTIEHHFVLAGVSAQYQISEYQNLYAGWAQGLSAGDIKGYRAVFNI
jgi:Fe(3+) dicitrate transport protein